MILLNFQSPVSLCDTLLLITFDLLIKVKIVLYCIVIEYVKRLSCIYIFLPQSFKCSKT